MIFTIPKVNMFCPKVVMLHRKYELASVLMAIGPSSRHSYNGNQYLQSVVGDGETVTVNFEPRKKSKIQLHFQCSVETRAPTLDTQRLLGGLYSATQLHVANMV